MEIEKAILVAKISDLEELEELKLLSKTAGVKVQNVLLFGGEPDPASFLRSGKLEELKYLVMEQRADLVIFNNDLSPVQLRNIEKEIPARIVDRTMLILDIFAQHARSKEGKIQVELAQLEYLLPRLTGRGETLSRLGGGIGTRGPGETKLEIDRRKIRKRIHTLKKELEEIKREREVQRKQRLNLPQIALVGYTNAGKSTLFNLLTGANVRAEDLLFATLDPTVRKVNFKNNWEVLISDTVGFIRNLPEELLTAFRATLEEIYYVDLILHVIDISDKDFRKQIEVVESILEDMGIEDKTIIRVYNKIDLLSKEEVRYLKQELDYKPSVFISAKEGIGIEKLKDLIVNELLKGVRRYKINIPYNKFNLFQKYRGKLYIEEENYKENFVEIKARVPKEYKKLLDELR
ncbi:MULTISPECIES: GTPase HflX [Dictyoglomus]|uniref:GTPase HflX n=1 Tax=Dictyoglomus turgidum (strain DSM 6724 / Z-1310) TaxID=515635 RepID=B8E283_DICTD|nr:MULTISPECIES: GTPase HflX [Dictyoglomus]ACK42360.1 GTP-binding proten HflX [Dictyoglomus turgidum DSM 6724]HBU32184.1 GTPase HflX [Dictyoglomus sp.]